ncbi:MAG TPA: S41 family peptidase [Candidatus Tumulicola sp.]|nr:S41 family peptidase [Candidatus Tumulicola sp.]
MSFTRLAATVLAAVVILAGAVLVAERANVLPRPSASQYPLLAFRLGNERHDFTIGANPANPQDRSQDLQILDLSLKRVNDNFYKPVSDAGLLTGERRGLLAFLKKKKIDGQLPQPDAATGDPDTDAAAANKILNAAFDRYGARVSLDDLTTAAVSGMLGTLSDPYTVFLSPREVRSLNELMRGGDFGGIGIYIGKDPKTKDVEVLNPIEGTPASRAGLKPLDIIVAVDGHETKPIDLDSVMGLIRGKVGTAVRLDIERKGSARKTYTVVREQIHVPSVSYHLIGKDVGYVQLYDFGDTSEREVTDALDKLLAKGAKAIVFDLRNNGGGLLDAAVQVSSKFIADGPIVSTVNRRGQVETQDAYQDAIQPKPLVVLVNQYSASASEITAGAIQDSRVGVLLGTKTYGKGVVQTIYDLPGNSAIKITTARYLTPDGRDIDKRGIEPNIRVPMDPKIVGLQGKDVQLQAAVDYLRKQIALDTRNP